MIGDLFLDLKSPKGGRGGPLPDGVTCASVLQTFHPFGVPLEVTASHPWLIQQVRVAVAGWEGAKDEGVRPLRIWISVEKSLRGADTPCIRIAQGRLRLTGRGLACVADARTGRARCLLSRNYVENEELFQGGVLDPVMLFLLTRNGRIPIHAAGALAGDKAILLAGRSGTGKSCLAQAALDAGFTILSDDTVYAEPEPSNRVWGIPRPVHLYPENAPSDAGGVVRLRNGKLKQAVPIRPGGHVPNGEAVALCLLSRGREASLEYVGPDEAMRSLAILEPGFDLLEPEILAKSAALVRHGAWRLTLSGVPSEAIHVLRANLPRLMMSPP